MVWELFRDLGAREQIWSRGQKSIPAKVANKSVVVSELSLWTAPSPALPRLPRFRSPESDSTPPLTNNEFPKQKVESLDLNQGDLVQS